MAGKLYGIGVGPGDPELMTIKGLRLLKAAEVIAIPAADKESCMAYRIARRAALEIEERELLCVDFPMTKDPAVLLESHERAAEMLARALDTGKTVAFLTLGDPTVYSTYLYIHKKLAARGYETEIVNGTPSFCAAAARLSAGLGEGAEAIHILPGSYPIEEGLALSGMKVLMKSGRQLGKVKEQLVARGEKARMVENCGMDGERVFIGAENFPEQASYYSLILVEDGKDRDD
ncbi:MAG: precorrin-2 C(20)-methyltransferase [Lachnospiraceae bacterium]|nr:precorrin-2 C(20)-methyltransferase [Lachnospiraceae bacterium]